VKLKRVITKGYTNCVAQYDPPKNLKLSAVLYQSSYSTADWSVRPRSLEASDRGFLQIPADRAA